MKCERRALPEQHYLYVERESVVDGAAIAAAMGSGFAEVFGFVQGKGVKPLSMPATVYMEMPGEKLRFRSAVFVSAEDAKKAEGAVKAGLLPAGEAVTGTHVGPYASLNESHKALWKFAESEGLPRTMPVWEIYIDDPTETPEEKLRTEIYCMT